MQTLYTVLTIELGGWPLLVLWWFIMSVPFVYVEPKKWLRGILLGAVFSFVLGFILVGGAFPR